MAAAGLGKALDQRLVLRVEKQQANVDADRLEPAHRRGQLREREPAAGIDRDRDALVARLREGVDGGGEERCGQVVDAIEVRVLEDVQRDALTRAGEAADDHDLHSACRIARARELQQTTKARARSPRAGSGAGYARLASQTRCSASGVRAASNSSSRVRRNPALTR